LFLIRTKKLIRYFTWGSFYPSYAIKTCVALKKYLLALVGIHLVLLISGILQSCCSDEYRIINEGYLRATEDTGDEQDPISEVEVIRGPFTLIADFETEIVSRPSLSFVSSAYALSCDRPILNLIEEESIVLTIDRSVIWNGDTLEPNTNLLELQDAGIDLPAAYPGLVEFAFSSSFFDQIEWIEPAYTFVFSALTNDGVQLDARLTLPVE
jgi:hypothetical protein